MKIFSNKKWSPTEIAKNLEENPYWVARAVVALYNLQESAEKSAKMTGVRNSVGFNMMDAPILTSIAEQYLNKGSLTEKQINLARKKVFKYVKQLTRLANGEL